MKKKVLIALLMVFVLMFAGCKANEPVVTQEAVTAVEPEVKEEPVKEEPAKEEPDVEEAVSGEGRSIGFVMIGLGNAFFDGLQKEFAARFIASGWEVDVANGEFNPQTQITAMENFIAMEKDVIVLWPVSPEPLNTVAQQAMDAGIKLLAFVQPTENFDASMQADNVGFAKSQADIATAWVEANFPDAADGSIPVAIVTRDNVDNTKQQGDALKEIESYSSKFKLVSVIDNDEESIEAGVKVAETIYTMNPEVKIFLTVNSAVALGINNYFTAMNSPVTDYEDMGIFTVNGGPEIFEQIVKSQTNEAPLRGTIMTGGIPNTVDTMMQIANGMLDGTYANKYVKLSDKLYIVDSTVNEYLETGWVTTLTEKDFE